MKYTHFISVFVQTEIPTLKSNVGLLLKCKSVLSPVLGQQKVDEMMFFFLSTQSLHEPNGFVLLTEFNEK